jgi:YD repeat-containing protein
MEGQAHLYTYDQQSNLITRTDAAGQVTQYAYDPLNRLTSVDYPSSTDVSYVLDENGNKTQITDSLGTTLLTYDALDRLTQVVRPDGYTIAYEYDAVGNRTKVTYPSGLLIQYYYSANNEMSRVNRNGKIDRRCARRAHLGRIKRRGQRGNIFCRAPEPCVIQY